jgi:hypothetical protein
MKELQTNIFMKVRLNSDKPTWSQGAKESSQPGAWSELAKVWSNPEQLISVCTWFPIEKV